MDVKERLAKVEAQSAELSDMRVKLAEAGHKVTTAEKASETATTEVRALKSQVGLLEKELTPAREAVAELERVDAALTAAGLPCTEKIALADGAGVVHVCDKRIIALAADKVKAEDKIVSLEVGALIGVKISKAEEADCLELRKTNPKLFEKMILGRPNLGGGNGLVAMPVKVMGADPNPPPSVGVDKSAGDELGQMVEKGAPPNASPELGSML